MSSSDNVVGGMRPYLRARKDKWRVKCPKGHTEIRKRQAGFFYCSTCNEQYDTVVDTREGVLLSG